MGCQILLSFEFSIDEIETQNLDSFAAGHIISKCQFLRIEPRASYLLGSHSTSNLVLLFFNIESCFMPEWAWKTVYLCFPAKLE
jgi:hypothetical protein